LAPADPLFDHGEGLRDEGLLKRALAEEEIVTNFDVVILDTPPSLDILLLNALTAAHWVVVPFVPHPLSSEGVRQLMRVLFKILSGTNQQFKLAGFLPMMSNDHIRIHRTVTGNVANQFGASRLLPIIRSDIRLAESFAAGKPIRHYAPKKSRRRRLRPVGDFSRSTVPVMEVLSSHKICSSSRRAQYQLGFGRKLQQQFTREQRLARVEGTARDPPWAQSAMPA
jgi:chromosome partitioning protein